jgi:hypothetical protein
MPTMWETFPVKFEGGWRTDLGRLDQGMAAPGSATKLENFEPSINGGYAKIKGYEKFSSTVVDAEETSIVGVIVADVTTALVRKGDKYYTSTGTTWTEKLEVTTGGATKLSHDTFNFDGDDKIVIVDGVEDPAVYDVTTGVLTLDTGAPADVTGASIVKVFKNHVFFAKGPLLTFTAPFEEDNYEPGDGAGTINVGGVITGLIVFREQLIIFTIDSILRLSGNTEADFVLQPITNKTGCLSPHTIQEVGGDILYLGPDGIRWLSATEKNNDFGLDRASSNIQNEVVSAIAGNNDFCSTVIRSKNQYRIFLYQDSKPTNLSEGLISTIFSNQSVGNISWSKIVGMKVWAVDSKQFEDREVIFFSSDTNYVYKMESSNGFDGGNIRYVFETPYMPINDPRIRKTIYKHSVYIKPTGNFEINAQLRFDYNPSGGVPSPSFTLTRESGGIVWGSFTWGSGAYGAAGAQTLVNQTVGSGFVVALRYEGNDTNPPFNMDYTVLEFRVNERR